MQEPATMQGKQSSKIILPSCSSENANHEQHTSVLRVCTLHLFFWGECKSMVTKSSHRPIISHCTPFLVLIKAFFLEGMTKSKMLQIRCVWHTEHSSPSKLRSFHLGDVSTGLGCTQFQHQKLVHLCYAYLPITLIQFSHIPFPIIYPFNPFSLSLVQ